ncbi:MAG: ABC transporter ATP-binding protein [Alphaproteobacteria bacterium]|nr:ABC transporter ATP-binding protein [Alphaproteobacteria bacterium]
MTILQVKDLSVCFHNPNQKASCPVKNVSFNLQKGEILGIVGESGSGKTLTALSILGLLPYPKAFHSPASSIKFQETELINNPNIRNIQGNRIGFIFQEPMSSLNPLHTIEHQIAETLIQHQGLSKKQARHEVLKLLLKTGIKNAKQKLKSYPHELSGGQRQRVMIAMAIANKPDILIADEPTTALDVTVQEQIIELLLKLRKQMGMSIVFISHDLRLINRIADNVIVMKDGQIIEQGNCYQIFTTPKESYTKTLIEAHNTLKNNKITTNKTLLTASNINVCYPKQKSLWGGVKQWFYAVNNISFSLKQGQTLGIVGESGSGKTTLGQAICKLIPFKGQISIADKTSTNWHKQVQIVFQDPYNSLNPRMNVGQIIGEGLEVHFPHLSKAQKFQKVSNVLQEVGLPTTSIMRYPHEFSGGQRQRIAIARALIVEPQVLVLDEPTSALDVTIQAQILKLLQQIQTQKGISYIFISHNMQAIQSISDEIAVIKDGQIIEQGDCKQIFQNPKHPYTQQLIKASAL